MIQNLIHTLQLAGLVLLVAGFFVGRAVLRYGGRASKRAVHHLERRAIDAVLVWLGYHLWHRWFKKDRPRPALQGDDMYAACIMSRFTGDPARCRWCNDELPARSTRWCGTECRVAGEENHIFAKARDAAQKRDGYRCKTCGAQKTKEYALEVNHAAERAWSRHKQQGCVHHLSGLETLCHDCHAVVTARQRQDDMRARNRGRRAS